MGTQNTNVRVVGGNTTLLVNGKSIAFLESVSDSAPTPVSAAVPVYELDTRHPREIVTGNVTGVGTLTLTLVELWDEEAWERLTAGLQGKKGILDVYEAGRHEDITCQKLIKTPNGGRRGRVYHGCKITSIAENETMELGQMVKKPQVTIQYTHWTPM